MNIAINSFHLNRLQPSVEISQPEQTGMDPDEKGTRKECFIALASEENNLCNSCHEPFKATGVDSTGC